jgi:hypothetical protein
MLDGPTILPLVILPLVIFPSMVAFVALVKLFSGVLMFCAFTEFNPVTAIAARRGIIRTDCFLII